MTAPTDHEAALALLRERFPESEGWSVSVRHAGGFARVRVLHNELPVLAEEDFMDCLTAARSLIASWDAATHAAQVRALVEAAENVQGLVQELRAAKALHRALAALPASLRGKGGERG